MAKARPRQTSKAIAPRGFDFCRHMRALCEDMSERLSSLRHVDMTRVAVSFSQARKAGVYGMYASLTPLRFADGSRETVRRGRRWRLQQLNDPSGREMLYVLSFYLPRFLDLAFSEKLNTVVHELWHISPQFNGDVRRFKGRCFAHGGSQKKYDAHAKQLVAEWLALEPPESLYGFLRCGFRELAERHGGVYGMKIRTPRLIPLDPSSEPSRSAG